MPTVYFFSFDSGGSSHGGSGLNGGTVSPTHTATSAASSSGGKKIHNLEKKYLIA